MRRRLDSPWTRAFLAWTAVLALLAAILFVAAVVGFLGSADDCWFQTGPCSTAGDASFVTLQIAVFGIPILWLVGVLVGVVARVVAHRGDAASR